MKTLVLVMIVAFSSAFTSADIVGTWVGGEGEYVYGLTFHEDGTYEIDMGNDGTADVKGTYTFSEGTLTMTDTEGERMCEGSGSYEVSVEGEGATFSLVEDECEGRSQMDGETLTKS